MTARDKLMRKNNPPDQGGIEGSKDSGEDEDDASWGGGRSDTYRPGGVEGATCAALPGIGRHCPTGEAFDIGGPGRPPGGGGRQGRAWRERQRRVVGSSV